MRGLKRIIRITAFLVCGSLLGSSAAYAAGASEFMNDRQRLFYTAAAAAAGAAGTNPGQAGISGFSAAFSADDLSSLPTVTETTVLSDWDGDVTRTDSERRLSQGTLNKKTYSGAGLGDCTVYMQRFTAETSSQAAAVSAFQLGRGQAVVRSYDASTGKWTEAYLKEGILPYGMYFIKTADGGESIFISPQRYKNRENGMIEYIPSADGGLRVTEQDGRYYISLVVPAMSAGEFCDFTALCSGSALVDWSDSETVKKWENYRFADDNRWCFDGYYYRTPSTYYPSGDRLYYKLPAAYITGKMAKNKGDAASRALCLSMTDTMQARINAQGYIPSENLSTWLKSSYSIEAGYFDTRFNTDFAMAELNAAASFGAEELVEDAAAYGDFLVSYAENRHYTVSSSSGSGEGWLVDDYWNEKGNVKRTHVSLNHQAAEAVFLYRLSSATGQSSYAVTAERLVSGLEALGTKWIMPDGNLYYSYGNDGRMISGDYPYLTYNDLLELQSLYKARHGAGSKTLGLLLESKLQWMNANGVTGYNR